MSSYTFRRLEHGAAEGVSQSDAMTGKDADVDKSRSLRQSNLDLAEARMDSIGPKSSGIREVPVDANRAGTVILDSSAIARDAAPG
jgi:hypothetical protein